MSEDEKRTVLTRARMLLCALERTHLNKKAPRVAGILQKLIQVEQSEWPKLFQFGMFGFLLQMGLGIGFSAGDAGFFSNVGASNLPLVFLLTPLVMLVFTTAYSFLLVRMSIDRVVDIALATLAIGGVALWWLLGADLSSDMKTKAYFALKLYLTMWYFGLYTLFWSYTDTYFNIQDAKRVFPLFAAFCALGTASGAFLVHVLADVLPMREFLVIWAAIAVATMPLVRMLRRRWSAIDENDVDATVANADSKGNLSLVFDAFLSSRFSRVYALALFITLLLTNLIEYQYATVLAESRSEADLAALFGALYTAASLFNLFICIFVFNRLVSRLGVRNVALILPATYFIAFGFLFLRGGEIAAIAAFFAYHGILTSIDYNNQNFLFNAVPLSVKKPLRAVIEGMCEPLASLFAGGLLLYAANYVTQRELSGIGIIVGAFLIVVIVLLRHNYPAAMAANMRHGSLTFGDERFRSPELTPAARKRLQSETEKQNSPFAETARLLLGGRTEPKADAPLPADADALLKLLDVNDSEQRIHVLNALSRCVSSDDIHLVQKLTSRFPEFDRQERHSAVSLIGKIGDTDAIPDILTAACALPTRDRRAITEMLTTLGEVAIPHLSNALHDQRFDYQARSIAARALANLSYAQFSSRMTALVLEELTRAQSLSRDTDKLLSFAGKSSAIRLLSQAQRERVARSVDFVLELLALGGKLPNYDLLVLSLHSKNPKVQANAFEAIESSIDYATYRSIVSLLQQKGVPAGAAETGADDVLPLIMSALEHGQGIESVAAAQALHELSAKGNFAKQAHNAITKNMPPMLHQHIVRLLNLGDSNELDVITLLDGLQQTPDLGAAPLDVLTAIAACARKDQPASAAVSFKARGVDHWVAYEDVYEIASRHPELALILLRMGGAHRHAA